MNQPQSALAVSFEGRAAGRLAVGFILEIAAIGRQKEGLLDSLLAGAIIEANTHRLAHDPALQMAYAYTDTPPPDALRRPVSINALAASLRLPFETVRRHVRRLADLGICVATPQGVIVPDSPSVNFGPGADFSIECWVKPGVASTAYGGMDLVDKRRAPNDFASSGYALALGDGKLLFQISDSLDNSFLNLPASGPDLRDGGCGQLRARAVGEKPVTLRRAAA